MPKSFKHILLLALFSLCAACGSTEGGNATPIVNSPEQATIEEDNVSVESIGAFIPKGTEEIRVIGTYPEEIRNCIEDNPSIQKEPSRTRASTHVVEWIVGGEVNAGVNVDLNLFPIEALSPGQAGINLGVSMNASYGSSWEQSEQQGEGWQLPGKPGYITTYDVEWSEAWQPGYVEVLFSNQDILVIDVNYRTRISSRIVSENAVQCEGSSDNDVDEAAQSNASQDNDTDSTQTTDAKIDPNAEPPLAIFDVNRSVRSNTNPDIKVTWTTVELDSQTNTTIVRLLFENESNEVLTIEVNGNDSYLNYEDGSRVNPLNVPDANQFGRLIVNVQPGTKYAAWIEFPNLIDIPQELALYIHSPYGGAEKFPILGGVQIEQQ
ncbi:MAG: hypothetical protein H6668_21300 [Ardenticatenaceae bacterium]|nr:hypothetical protein [Ardenticatenaceae bacterium]